MSDSESISDQRPEKQDWDNIKVDISKASVFSKKDNSELKSQSRGLQLGNQKSPNTVYSTASSRHPKSTLPDDTSLMRNEGENRVARNEKVIIKEMLKKGFIPKTKFAPLGENDSYYVNTTAFLAENALESLLMAKLILARCEDIANDCTHKKNVMNFIYNLTTVQAEIWKEKRQTIKSLERSCIFLGILREDSINLKVDNIPISKRIQLEGLAGKWVEELLKKVTA